MSFLSDHSDNRRGFHIFFKRQVTNLTTEGDLISFLSDHSDNRRGFHIFLKRQVTNLTTEVNVISLLGV